MSTDPDQFGREPNPHYEQPVYSSGDPFPPDRNEAGSKKLAAGLCAILLAGLGIHKFILGYTNAGIIMLAVSLSCALIGSCLIFPLLGCFAMGAISIAEGIIYLTKSDEEFFQTYMVGKKEWF